MSRLAAAPAECRQLKRMPLTCKLSAVTVTEQSLLSRRVTARLADRTQTSLRSIPCVYMFLYACVPVSAVMLSLAPMDEKIPISQVYLALNLATLRLKIL